MDTPRVLLEHYLKQLRLPTMLREFPKLAEQCAKEGAAFEQFLLRLVEQEMMDRERRAAERRIKAAKSALGHGHRARVRDCKRQGQPRRFARRRWPSGGQWDGFCELRLRPVGRHARERPPSLLSSLDPFHSYR